MDKILQFNREKFDFEYLCKNIETLDLIINNISAIMVFLDDKLLSKAGKGYQGVPVLVFENQDKERILKRWQKHILFMEALQIIFSNPKKNQNH